MPETTDATATASDSSGRRRGFDWSWQNAAVGLAGLCLFVLITSPLPVGNPFTSGSGPLADNVHRALDYSWELVLQHADVTRMRFGRDIVFTYGPLGSLAAPIFYPAGYTQLLTLSTAFTASLAAAWLLHARRRGTNALAYLLSAWIAGTAIASDYDLLPDVAPLLLLAIYLQSPLDRRLPKASLLIVSVLCGVALLIKSTLFMSVGVVSIYLIADMAWARRSIPWPAAVIGFSAIATWFLRGQQAHDLAPYLRHSLQIISGYGEMALPTSLFHLCLWLAAAIALLWQLWAVFRGRWSRPRAAAAEAAVGCLVFLFFKHGFVRGDPYHVGNASLCLGLLTLLMWPMIGWNRSTAQCVLLASLFFLVGTTSLYDQLAATPADVRDRMFALLNYRREVRQARQDYTALQTAFRRQIQLPELSGTVDVYPIAQAVVFLMGWDYHPRPIFQSYSAYTMPLAEMNARFIASDRAPEHILFDVAPLDNRFPSQDDGYSWLDLFRHYQPHAGEYPDFLVLDHRASPRVIELTPLLDATSHFGQPVPVPDENGEPIWVQIDIPAGVIRSAASFIFREAAFHIEVTDSAKTTNTYRLVASTAGGGFLLSPVVATKTDMGGVFAELDGRPFPPLPRVTQIRLLGGITAPGDYSIRLYALHAQAAANHS